MELMYIYTNNNNIRHFFSMYEIMAKDFFETDKYYESISTIHPKGIFLTNKELSSKILNNYRYDYQNCYPVVIKVNTKWLKKLECYLITNDYRCEKGIVGEYNDQRHIGMFVPFFLPAFAIDSIWFRIIEEKDRFISTIFENINFEYYNFDVDDVYFNGSFDLDIEKLRECLKDIKLSDEYVKKIKLRRKIKSGLISAFGNFKIQINEDIFITFDRVFLNLFHYLFGNKYNIDKDLNKFKEKIKEDLSKTTDYTPFSYVLDRLLKAPKETLNLSDFQEKIDSNNFDNFFVYYYIRKKILDSNNSDLYEIDDVLNEMDFELNSNANCEEQKNDYRHFFKKIKELKTSIISIREVLEELNNRYPGLKSLVFVLSTDKNGTIVELSKKLNKYQVDPFVKRLSLFIYGMMVGLTYIDRDFKSSQTLMTLSDLISLTIYFADSYEKSNYDELKEILKYINNSDLKKETKDKLFLNYLGIKLPIYKVDYRHKIRLEMIELLKENQKEEKFKKIMPTIIESLRQFCLVKQFFKLNNFQQKIENGMVMQIFDRLPNQEYIWKEKMWENYKNEIIKNEKIFDRLNEVELKKLAEAIKSLK